MFDFLSHETEVLGDYHQNMKWPSFDIQMNQEKCTRSIINEIQMLMKG